jgi:hypothetical protein
LIPVVALIVSALIAAAAIVWAGVRIADAIRSARVEAAGDRALRLLGLFAPAMVAAEHDLRALLVWQPLARSARAMFAQEFALLDRAAGGTFPFGEDRLRDAHARWTAEWLAWERTHDADYKVKTAAVEQEISTLGTSPLARARLDAIEREKLDLYQRRYEEYIRVAKALQTLVG